MVRDAVEREPVSSSIFPFLMGNIGKIEFEGMQYARSEHTTRKVAFSRAFPVTAEMGKSFVKTPTARLKAHENGNPTTD